MAPNMWKDICIGSTAGVSGIIVGHPFDTLKVRLQHHDSAFTGAIQCLRETFYREGLRGFYRGILPPIGAEAINSAILFGVYGITNRMFGQADLPSYTQVYTSGVIAGTACALFTAPADLIKSRYQIQTGKSIGYARFIANLISTSGIRGMFQGLGATLVRDVPSFGIYFVVHEYLKRELSPNKDGKHVATPYLLFAGGSSGVAAWFSTYPVDVVKTRLQTQQNGKYAGMIDCAKKSWTEAGGGLKGLRVFYIGVVPTMIRSFPVNAAIFFVYDILMDFFG